MYRLRYYQYIVTISEEKIFGFLYYAHLGIVFL